MTNLAPLRELTRNMTAWDPALVRVHEEWFLYALATQEKVDLSNFFIAPNVIRGFKSRDLETWEDLGAVIRPEKTEEILCAGSTYQENGRVYLFYSKIVSMRSEYLIDQRICLAESTDGRAFRDVEGFSLCPDEVLYGTRCRDPETNAMLFAWRDPFVFRDPESGKYFVFICTGGFRWGVSPNVAVASSEHIAGPYSLHAPAIAYSRDKQGRDLLPLDEIERQHVRKIGSKYYLFASCWRKHVSKALLEMCAERKIEVSDSSLYVFEADNVLGPYRLCVETPVVSGSSRTGLYGGMFVEQNGNESILVGWRPEPEIELSVDRNMRVKFDANESIATIHVR